MRTRPTLLAALALALALAAATLVAAPVAAMPGTPGSPGSPAACGPKIPCASTPAGGASGAASRTAARGTATAADLAARVAAAGGAPCDDDPASYCGRVTVPLNWSAPRRDPRTIGIAWRVVPHSSPTPAISTVAVVQGGPGIPSIEDGVFSTPYAVGPGIVDHDVLLVDQRGRGLSQPLDCPALQHATLPYRAAIAACGAQLGADVDLYSSASNARDLEAVRAALRIPTFDLFGISYGGADVTAYAARFGSHVRSIVFSSAVDATGSTPSATRLADVSAAIRRVQSGLCRDSAACTAERRTPLVALGLVALALRAHPLTGTAVDQFGETRTVTMTATRLITAAGMLGDITVTGWAAAAAESYLRGDTAPMLRLAAVEDASYEFLDSGEAADNSAAINAAQQCADLAKPWRDGLSYDQRIASARSVLARAPQAQLLPFTTSEHLAETDWALDGPISVCSSWPDTHAEPVLPPGARMPDVPVLSVVGDYDTVVPQEESARVAGLFRHAQTLTIDGGIHVAGYTRCGPDAVSAFLATLGRAPSRCSDPGDGRWQWFLQPSFPVTAADLSTATVTRRPGDASTAADRRIVQGVWKAVLDSWMQGNDRPGGFTNAGLRGGSMSDAALDDTWIIDFDSYRFVRDVAITGHLDAPYEDQSASTADLSVVGPGGVTGTLHLTLDLRVGRDGGVTATGTLGGRAIAVALPST